MNFSEDETARVILMQMMDDGQRSFVWFVSALREETGRMVTGIEAQQVWDQYMGRDGLVSPTHNIETGERL